MIVNYGYCQMPLGSNKQPSKFTVPSFLLVLINPKWVMFFNKTAPSQNRDLTWVASGCTTMFLQYLQPVTKIALCECDPKEPLRLADAMCLLRPYNLQKLNFTSGLWIYQLHTLDIQTTRGQRGNHRSFLGTMYHLTSSPEI